MRYYTNAIGSLFGLFGGKKVIAVPDMDDVAGMPEVRIKILRSIADSAVLENILFKDDKEAKEAAAHTRIKADKIADYQERLLDVNGYRGTVDFAAMDEIHQEMAEDWWLSSTAAPTGEHNQ